MRFCREKENKGESNPWQNRKISGACNQVEYFGTRLKMGICRWDWVTFAQIVFTYSFDRQRNIF